MIEQENLRSMQQMDADFGQGDSAAMLDAMAADGNSPTVRLKGLQVLIQ